jgi:hypothetical protein
LHLGQNKLEGTIPSEVGQLTKLSESTKIDCLDVLALSLWAFIHIQLVILMVVWTVCAAFLVLSNNTVTGTIPSEVGMLSDSLGKFIVEESTAIHSARPPNCIGGIPPRE